MKLTTDLLMDTCKHDKSIQTDEGRDHLDFRFPGLDYMGQKRKSDTLEIPQAMTPDIADSRRSSGGRRGSLWSLASGSSRGSGASCASGKSLILPAVTLPPPPEYLELQDRKVKHYI